MSLVLESTAFQDGEEVPPRYTCDDADISPPLSWAGIDGQAESLVLIVEDPDAPDPAAPRMTWDHWLLYNIPVDCRQLAEDVASVGLPSEVREGRNSWGRCGYGGPCPPTGRHRYFFRLYSLDTRLPELGEPDKPALLKAMQGHVLQETHLLGTYQRI